MTRVTPSPPDKTGQKIFAVTVRVFVQSKYSAIPQMSFSVSVLGRRGQLHPMGLLPAEPPNTSAPPAGSHHRGVTSSRSAFQSVDALHFPAICMRAFLFLMRQISKIGSCLVLTFQNTSALFLCGRPGCDNAPQGQLEMARLLSKPPPQQPFWGFEGNT